MVSRRERNHIRKAIHEASGSGSSSRKKQQQQQIQVQHAKGIAILKEDDFTGTQTYRKYLEDFCPGSQGGLCWFRHKHEGTGTNIWKED